MERMRLMVPVKGKWAGKSGVESGIAAPGSGKRDRPGRQAGAVFIPGIRWAGNWGNAPAGSGGAGANLATGI